jgi:hypothetical protein
MAAINNNNTERVYISSCRLPGENPGDGLPAFSGSLPRISSSGCLFFYRVFATLIVRKPESRRLGSWFFIFFFKYLREILAIRSSCSGYGINS